MSQALPGRRALARRRLLSGALATAAAATAFAAASPAQAWNVVTTTNGDNFTVNDAAIPGLDTGSIHNTATGSLMGYGGIRMNVVGATDRLQGILLRGFGLKYDGVNSFESANAVQLDGIAVKRAVTVNKASSWIRYFDSFTNTTKGTLTVDVAFGGQLGYNTGSNQSTISTTSSGDALITSADGWASFYTPSAGAGSASFNGPSATTTGTPGFAGALTKTGNFLRDPFTNPLATTGDEANHFGFVNRLIIPPKQTRSLAHFVATALSETRAAPGGGAIPAAGSQVTAVQATAASLTTSPPLSDLSTGQICSLANYNLATVAIPGFSPASCPAVQGEPLQGSVMGAVTLPPPLTTSPYDVTGKSITDLVADMKSGKTTAQQITRAYLDRIAAYDQGPLGLHSVLTVAPDAMAQAKAADDARAAGDTRPLLGVPILAKDIYDTKDMPTTGGSLVFDGYRPTKDAWIVAKLREAGALILGKANLSEFANDGHFSSSAYGQVWNAFDPSRSSIGSSGGSAVSVASSFAAAALGTQTGDSLWGPSSAASLVSLRGTDGMQSTDGVMPLTYIQDYAGVIARSIPDLVLLLNATAIGNPNDPLDDVSNGRRPTDWTASLNASALQGKTIGVPATAFNDLFGGTGTSDAMRAQFVHFTEAGATVKNIADPPPAPAGNSFGDTNYEGWLKWVKAHPDNPYTDVPQITRSALRIPQFRNATPYTGTGEMTDAQIKGFQDYRANYRAILAQWMSDQGVDAVVFPGELSDIHLNDSIQPSFGRRDPQSSASGVPTVIFPAGVNDHGQPINLQLEGPAFTDAALVGYAYAFEAKAKGHVESALTPSLKYDPTAIVAPVTPATPAPAPVSVPGPTTVITEAAKTPGAPPVAASFRRVTLLKRNLKADSKGRFGVQVGCASEQTSCTASIVVRRTGKVVLKKSIKVLAGRSRTVTVIAPLAVRPALARHTPVTFAVSFLGTGLTRSTAAVNVKVRQG